MLTPLALRVISRIRRLNRSRDFGANVRLMAGAAVKLNPRNFRSCGRATALLASFTLSLSVCVMKQCSASPADPRVRCERRCYSRPHNEQSGVRGTPARGRVRRARGYSAVAKAVLLAEFLPRWG